jgi:ATPase subunit of ABC transporter with duplicated ATPase domains
VPRFSIDAECVRDQTVVSVDNGSIGYSDCMPLLRDINIQLNGRDRIAIYGDNGSGKSTLIKGIMTSPHMIRSGTWHVISDVGYLDQHYNTLSPHKSVFETIAELAPTWSESQIRCYLNDFLFRKNQEVYVNTDNLSGGERVRLSLALIGLKTPRLLILDEVTNNIDFETREHVIQVLKAYPGALIVISHDEDFLQQINVCHGYKVDGSMLHHQSSDIRVQK